MIRLAEAVACFCVGAIVILGLCALGYYSGFIVVFPHAEHQVELLTIFLAAATLVVTAVGVVVALGAIVGYTGLREEIRSAVNREARSAGREAGEKAVQEVLEPALRRVQETLISLTSVKAADRTEDITAALAERGDYGGRAPG